MMMKVFAVYDSKSEAFDRPFFLQTVGSAVRAFTDACTGLDSPFAKHPGDYQLYEIGTFDNGTAMLEALVPMKLLGCAADFIQKPVVYKPAAVDPVEDNMVIPNGSK